MKHVKTKVETEALITAAEDQALNIKAHKKYIMKALADAKCTRDNLKHENVAHILYEVYFQTSCSN